jgi:hypothetical protein
MKNKIRTTDREREEQNMKCSKYEKRNEKKKENKNELDYFIYYFCSLLDS